MRIYLVPAAIAAAFVSTPVAADTGRMYVGGDVGLLLPRDTEIDITDVPSGNTFDNAIDIEYNTGFDIDGFFGYDFGMFKAEIEGGFKHSNFDAIDPSTEWVNFLQSQLPGVIIDPSDIDLDDGIDIISVMGNGYVDFGRDEGFGGYIGGGLGYGWAKAYGESNGSFAWQIVAGARYPITPDIDIGLKYKYFDMSSLDFRTGVDVVGNVRSTDIGGNWRSHSILFNFTYDL